MRKAVSQAMAPFSRGLGVGRAGAGLEREGGLPEDLRGGGMAGSRMACVLRSRRYYRSRQVGQLRPPPTLDQGSAAALQSGKGGGNVAANVPGFRRAGGLIGEEKCVCFDG